MSSRNYNVHAIDNKKRKIENRFYSKDKKQYKFMFTEIYFENTFDYNNINLYIIIKRSPY